MQVTIHDLEEAYRIRGVATDKERDIEDKIFSKEAIHSDKEIEGLLEAYRKAKDERAVASINAARLFMMADKSTRTKAQWRKYTPGHENDKGRGSDSPII